MDCNSLKTCIKHMNGCIFCGCTCSTMMMSWFSWVVCACLSDRFKYKQTTIYRFLVTKCICTNCLNCIDAGIQDRWTTVEFRAISSSGHLKNHIIIFIMMIFVLIGTAIEQSTSLFKFCINYLVLRSLLVCWMIYHHNTVWGAALLL